MDLKPKHSLSPANNRNQNRMDRRFVGRIEPRQNVKDAVDAKKSDEYKVIHYYGIGGIGKTRLQKEMAKEIEQHNANVLIGHLNFEAVHLNHVEGALLELREQLKDTYKVQFDSFDLACAALWKKINPHLSLQANQNDLPFIEEGNYLAELISLVDGLPFVQWLPKTIQFGQTLSTKMRKWKVLSGKLSSTMKEINSLQAFEIEERLPLFFAEDIRQFLKGKTLTLVIFIDTYEALYHKGRHSGSFNEHEEWVKELILQLPEVLWLLFGREQLNWNHQHPDWDLIIQQSPVNFLSAVDAEAFLAHAGVEDQTIRTMMIEVSGGLPYQLDLLVDTYELIQESKIPELGDFSDSPTLIVDRLMRCLTLAERELLKVLSFPRKWNESLFKSLITKLAIGYPATAIEEITRFSFVSKIDNDQWEMHPIMKRNLQNLIKQENIHFYEQIHQLLFYEYESQLNALGELLDSKAEISLSGMAYHATKFKLSPNEESDLIDIMNRFYQAGRFKFFTPLSPDLQQVLSTFSSDFLIAQAHVIAGDIASIQGRLDFALEQFELANKHLTNVNPSIDGYFELFLRIKREAANIYIKQTSYEKAREVLLSACTLGSHKSFNSLQLVQACILLGKLENDSSNKSEAAQWYDNALELIEKYLLKDPDNAEALSVKGTLYEKKGEWLTRNNLIEQRKAYKTSIDCYEKATNLTTSLPLEIEVDRGLAWKRLAENYSKQDHLQAETIQAFETAISIYDGIVAEHGDYVEALIKRGHAAVDFFIYLGKCGLYEEVEAIFQMAIASFEQAIELSMGQASAQNRIASAHQEMAIIYQQMGDNKLAQTTLNQAIVESRRLIRNYPQYRYSQNTIDKIQKSMKIIGL